MNITKLKKAQHLSKALSKIRQFFPTAIIAGGVIRDLCHNKPIKDIDIYISEKTSHLDSITPRAAETIWKQIFDVSGYDDYIEILDGSADYVDKNHISRVWEIRSGENLYNIIVVDIDPVRYVTEFFDVGLCKAYYDGKKIRLTNDFLRDSKNKTLTIVAPVLKQREFDKMMQSHVTKLQKKYADYYLIVNEQYDTLYAEYLNTHRKTK